MLELVDIIIPSFHSRDLTALTISSFEKFSNGYKFRYIVVENSDDISYKDFIIGITGKNNVQWVQHPTKLINSEANATAIEEGLKYVTSKRVFMCHNDVVACHPTWMKYMMRKMDEGNMLVGFREDTTRINALHSSGLLVDTKIAKSVSMFPVYENDECIMDVCDSLTKYCRDNSLPYFKAPCTFNIKGLREKLNKKYQNLTVDIGTNDNNKPIFIHLGRGITRLFGRYHKKNRTTYEEWFQFVFKEFLTE
ncbi:hypothetical protein CMI47_12605 [Candidatus Pacearchaeota archaeon]|nr:hypothetical protein [Candidatus Pacearchaeota archaeon]